jgi:hypothetical protein
MMSQAVRKVTPSQTGSPTSRSQAFDKKPLKDFSSGLALNPLSNEDL